MTASLHLRRRGERLELRLDPGDGGAAGILEAEGSARLPWTADDAEDLRWLLEDHRRLQGRSADGVAGRIARRLGVFAAQLGGAVFGGAPEIAGALKEEALLRRLHVTVEDADGSPTFPWELLPAPGRPEPLSAAASFVRGSPGAEPRGEEDPGEESQGTEARGEEEQGELRILLLICRPAGEEDVPFRTVASRLVRAVAAAPEARLGLQVLRPPTFPALRQALEEARQEGRPYDAVHFDGHGVLRGSPLDPAKLRSYLRFEGEGGGADDVPGPVLGRELARQGVRWLLLNACRSAAPVPAGKPGAEEEAAPEGAAPAFTSLAQEVRASGVAGVLAMGFNLYVVTAARLVAGVYAALAAGRGLGEAVAHARRHLYQAGAGEAAGAFDWLVPAAFGDAEAEGTREGRGDVPRLPVGADAATPPVEGLTGLGEASEGQDGPFFGRDGVLLRLDRELSRRRPVELVGLAGAGKSAVAREMARWWARTSGEGVAFADVAARGSFQGLAEALAPGADGLVVLDGAGEVLKDRAGDAPGEGASPWSGEDRRALAAWMEERAAGGGRLLWTGRSEARLAGAGLDGAGHEGDGLDGDGLDGDGLQGAATVTLDGLGQESRQELARHAGFGDRQMGRAPGLLSWSQGVPAVVRQLPPIAHGLDLSDPAPVAERLRQLRSGVTEPLDLARALVEDTGLAFFDPGRLRSPVLPFVLGLFQGYVGETTWVMFCQLVAAKGFDFLQGEDAKEVLGRELAAAVESGLASPVEGGYLLHPLTPICGQNAFAGTLQALSRGQQEVISRLMGMLWASYVQAISVEVRVAGQLAGNLSAAARERERRRRRQNLEHAVEIGSMGAWWGLLLPLLRPLRDELLGEGREAEWRSLLEELLRRLEEFPPEEHEMGPENAELAVVKLLAEEAARAGDDARAEELRDRQLRLARAEDVVLEPVEAGDGRKIMDVGRMRRIGALLKRGDVERKKGSPECLGFYREALREAEEGKDRLRAGEAHLALARAYLNVDEIRDFSLYERHARRALAEGEALGPLGHELASEGSLSLGNALLEQEARREEPDEERLQKAREALERAAASKAADPVIRASAHNGLGQLLGISGDLEGAADGFLAACKGFEEAGDGRGLVAAQTNAALALHRAGRTEDALGLAALALAGLRDHPALAPRLRPLLEPFLPALRDVLPSLE